MMTRPLRTLRHLAREAQDIGDVDGSVRGFTSYTAPADTHDRVMYGGGDWSTPREVAVMTASLVSQLEKAGEGSRYRVHPGQTSSRAKTTFWVRDRLDPKWPDGPYATREQAEAVLRALPNYQEKNNVG